MSHILTTVDEQIEFGTNYKVVTLGAHKIKRTVIPAKERVVRTFHIDGEADKEMLLIATKKGITIDELYRNLTWAYINAHP
ncbi:hypothetical protein ACFS6H_16515 [Terrimonas rubra]|uniref:ParG protein n=1 Tax=Terrimonas rubra TaxID=1035890 RepID=A0ABW6ABJ1_9BACT